MARVVLSNSCGIFRPTWSLINRSTSSISHTMWTRPEDLRNTDHSCARHAKEMMLPSLECLEDSQGLTTWRASGVYSRTVTTFMREYGCYKHEISSFANDH